MGGEGGGLSLDFIAICILVYLDARSVWLLSIEWYTKL